MSKKSFLGIKNAADSSTVELHFTDFIYDGFNWETWENENMVQDTIDKINAAKPTKIKMVINSLGGDVMIGLALYNFLKSYSATVEVEIIGFAASIASVMAMAASEGQLKMAKNGFMIIHAAWSPAGGTAKDLREQAEILDRISNELADVYAQRSGKSAKHFTDMWAGGDVWLTGTEAKALGLVDELINAEVKAHAAIKEFGFKNIPAELQNGPEPDKQNIFQFIKAEFMKIGESLKAAITGAKTENTAAIPHRDEILAMVESVLTPVIEKVDAAIEAIPTPPEAVDNSAAETRVKELEKELDLVKNQLAAAAGKPENEGTLSASDKRKAALASKIKVEHEN